MSNEIKTVMLGEILNDKQIARVSKIINTPSEDDQMLKELKKYLNTIKVELEEKGFVADYLAFVLYAKAKGII